MSRKGKFTVERDVLPGQQFAARLVAAIARSKLTRTQIAAALGVAPARISEWTHQGVLPEGKTLLRLPGILDCNGHWLLTGDGNPEDLPGEADALLAAVRALLYPDLNARDAVDAVEVVDRTAPTRGNGPAPRPVAGESAAPD